MKRTRKEYTTPHMAVTSYQNELPLAISGDSMSVTDQGASETDFELQSNESIWDL